MLSGSDFLLQEHRFSLRKHAFNARVLTKFKINGVRHVAGTLTLTLTLTTTQHTTCNHSSLTLTLTQL